MSLQSHSTAAVNVSNTANSLKIVDKSSQDAEYDQSQESKQSVQPVNQDQDNNKKRSNS